MPTNNPLPSSNLEDFKDNSIILDHFVNSQEEQHPDRFGRARPTITGIIREAFNVRTDISNMNETLIGQSRWDAVPKNTSLSLGGDNGALNKQAQALFNRTEMLKTHAREALRRTYEEVGLDLVEGSFEQGGVLVNTNDVLLQERTGKVFSGPAGTVAAGTNPASGGFVDQSGNFNEYQSINDAKQKILSWHDVKITDLAYQAVTTYIKPPVFSNTGIVDVAKSGQTDAFTYFYDAAGKLFERQLEFDPRAFSVMSYSEHWTLSEMNHIFDAMDCGIKGFYYYVDNGETGQLSQLTKDVVNILLKYNFQVVIGMSCPTTGYQAVVDFWADTFEKDNVAGIGFCDEPELKPEQTVTWQQAVISYIRTKSRKQIYVASVANLGAARSAVADEVDFVLWDYYRQNTTTPDLSVYAYDLSQIESLGDRPLRAIPCVGVFREPGGHPYTVSQITKWNQALIDMRPSSEDLWCFVFYTRPFIKYDNLITNADLRSILSGNVQYKKSKTGGGFDYALLGMANRSSYNLSPETTAVVVPGARGLYLSKTNEIRFTLKEPMELTRYAVTLSNTSGITTTTSTFLIQAYVEGAWVTVKQFTHQTSADGNPAFKDGSVGKTGWTTPSGVRSKHFRLISPDTYPEPLYKIYDTALVFGNVK